jgi:hypothetical protein
VVDLKFTKHNTGIVFFSECSGFPFGLFYHCSILTFILLLLLIRIAERSLGTSEKAMLSVKSGALERKVLSCLQFSEGLKKGAE